MHYVLQVIFPVLFASGAFACFILALISLKQIGNGADEQSYPKLKRPLGKPIGYANASIILAILAIVTQ